MTMHTATAAPLPESGKGINLSLETIGSGLADLGIAKAAKVVVGGLTESKKAGEVAETAVAVSALVAPGAAKVVAVSALSAVGTGVVGAVTVAKGVVVAAAILTGPAIVAAGIGYGAKKLWDWLNK